MLPLVSEILITAFFCCYFRLLARWSCCDLMFRAFSMNLVLILCYNSLLMKQFGTK